MASTLARTGKRASWSRRVNRARADGTYPRLLQRYAKIHVLVIDDLGSSPLEASERRDRLVHNAHRLKLHGESMRKKRGMNTAAEAPAKV